MNKEHIELTRKKWLDEILTAIFNTKNVNCTEWSDGDWKIEFDRNSFKNTKCTATYWQKYKKIFELALVKNDVEYIKDNKILSQTKKDIYNKRAIIKNAAKYFEKFGFEEEKYASRYSYDEIGKAFFNIIDSEIIPVIFADGGDMDNFVNEKEYNKCKAYFTGNLLDDALYLNAKNGDIQKIIDSDYVECECDIAIPIDSSDLYLYLGWNNSCVRILKKIGNPEFKAFSERNDLYFHEITEKVGIKYLYDVDARFKYPFSKFCDGFLEKNNDYDYYTITKTIIPKMEQLSRYFFFITNKEKYIGVKNYDDFSEIIKERIKDTYETKFNADLVRYYDAISDEITEMLKIIFSLDFQHLIAHDKETYKEIADMFNLDSVVLYNSAKLLSDNEEETIDLIYNILEKVIIDFSNKIKSISARLSKEYIKYWSANHINKHIQKIEEYINKSDFSSNIELLDKALKENIYRYHNIDVFEKHGKNWKEINIWEADNYFEGNYLKLLKESLEMYRDCLNQKSESEKWFDEKTESSETEKIVQDYIEKYPQTPTMRENVNKKISVLRQICINYLKTFNDISRIIIDKEYKENSINLDEYMRWKRDIYQFSIYPHSFKECILKAENKILQKDNNDKIEDIVDEIINDYKKELENAFFYVYDKRDIISLFNASE